MKKLLSRVLAVGLALLMFSALAAVTVSALEPHGNNILIRNWVRNDPNYTFSDAYKTSVWYENFNELELTQNTRNNILRIALSQLGYHEGDSADDFDGMNTSGSSNYIEYARLIVPNYNDNHYEWCACFVNWCLNQARVDYAYGEIGCWKWVEWLKANRMFEDSAAYGGTYTPQPADMIFFNWNSATTGNGTSGHIGFVLYVTETKIYTIEGNKGNEVAIHSYRIDDTDVIGFGTPAYPENDEPTIDFSCADGRPQGRYILKTANVRLIDAAGKDGQLIRRLQLGSTVVLLGVEDKYAHVRVGEDEGYVLVSALQLLTPATFMPTETETETETTTTPDTEPETETVTEPTTEPVTEPETVPATEPVTESATEPETVPVTEPETESVTEPETVPVTEPETEPITVTEPETAPITEPETEPDTTPITETETETDAETKDENAGCFASVETLFPTLSILMLVCLAARHLSVRRKKEQE